MGFVRVVDVSDVDVPAHATPLIGIREELRRSWVGLEESQRVLRRMQHRLSVWQACIDYSTQQVAASRVLLKSFER